MRIHRAWPLTLGLLVLLAPLAACVVPLGPGYHLRQETVSVHYRQGAPGLNYSLRAQVRNVGNRPLDSVTIQVPRRPPAGGQGPTSATLPATTAFSMNGRAMRFPLSLKPPLERRESRELRFGYVVPTRSDSFLLEPDEWFPTFVRPHALFAKGEPLARKTELRIFVPAGFTALTAGRFRGVRTGRPGGETEYRYEIRDPDFPPFLLIGRFVRGKIRSGKTNVDFWTREPLPVACSQSLAAQLAATDALYRSRFGRAGKHRRPIAVIEIPPESASRISEHAGGFGSVPGGVWFSVGPSRLCAQPERFFSAADQALAATWFGWAVTPEPDARAFLTGGAPRYAALVAEEGGSPAAARARQVKDWLGEYDRLRSRAKPIAPVRLEGDSQEAERKMAGIQSALFLIALQDRFGPVAIQHALAHLVSSLRGSSAGMDDVRSAFEQAAGRNLFDFFNEWQGRPGIPTGFRHRYAPANRNAGGERDSISTSRRQSERRDLH